jgi:hypothetical protein
MATKTSKSTSKKSTQPKRSPRPKGTASKTQPSDAKTTRRQYTQVKQWLHGSRPHKPKPLRWHDDTKLDQYEGRDGDDIIVVLTPYQEVNPPRRLAQKANATWSRMVTTQGVKTRNDVPLYIEQPDRKSGLQLFSARIHGLDHISRNGAVLYQLTAKDVADAKNQIAEVVVKLRLQAIDCLLHQLTCQLGRPPEAVLHLALSGLAQQHDTQAYVKKNMFKANQCRVMS